MTDTVAEEPPPPFPGGIGGQLRAAREERGLTLDQLAAETRIPQRHLAAIEDGEFAALPARTYAIGFSKTYARAVGLDEGDVAASVRAELDAQELGPRPRPPGFEPGDPARVPSSTLAWLAGAAAVLLFVGGFFFLRPLFAPTAELPSLVEQEEAEQAARAAAAAEEAEPASAQVASGPVVFTALEEGVWVRFYDADGRRLLEKLMALGERYTVPAEAVGPQLWTGRPDALGITVGGRPVPKLSEDDGVMRDVPVSAEALLARNAETLASAGSPTT